VTGSEGDLDSNHAVSILSESPVDAGLSHLTPKSETQLLPHRRRRYGSLRLAILLYRPQSRGSCLASRSAYPKSGYANQAPVIDSRLSGGSCFQVIRNQAFESSGDGSQWICPVLAEIKTHFFKEVPHFGRRKPFASLGRKYKFDGVLKAAALTLQFVNRLLVSLLLIFGKQRENGENQLSGFGEFDFRLVSLAHQHPPALHEIGEHFPVVDRRL